MEAANLGAYLSRLPDADSTAAIESLAAVPGFRPSVTAWARQAAAVVERYPGGTPQEIFQDACENYYGAPETITPMVLVGPEHWEKTFPAWPMLRSLAAGKPMEDRIFLVDTVEDALAVVAG